MHRKITSFFPSLALRKWLFTRGVHVTLSWDTQNMVRLGSNSTFRFRRTRRESTSLEGVKFVAANSRTRLIEISKSSLPQNRGSCSRTISPRLRNTCICTDCVQGTKYVQSMGCNGQYRPRSHIPKLPMGKIQTISFCMIWVINGTISMHHFYPSTSEGKWDGIGKETSQKSSNGCGIIENVNGWLN